MVHLKSCVQWLDVQMDISGVPQVLVLGWCHLTFFIGNMGSGIEYTFGKFANDTDTLKVRDAIQRD